MAGPPDSGIIVTIPQAVVNAGGMPLAVTNSICQMINSLSGAPYPMTIGPLASSGVKIAGQAMVRIGDMIPSGSGILTIIGPPAAPYINDKWPP
jgi:hypothetical protein